ncbi:MAG TPA: 4-hydroxybenzoate octaprenyltransferase [Rhodospirillaceae bacterium]|nr:MAG: hypothetical protein A2018_01555 [Alphaproteobacteria bacterium GWF2_58_20]HAU28529.1 4-hydroxybenzoate octaprenyltransferase [Rhodospirillaceae bacterium]
MHTDMTARWPEKFPAAVRPFLYLARVDRPVGAWLLLLPCFWGVALAGGGLHAWRLYFLFTVGAFLMRGAGCVINDILDRDIDRKVERTAQRPLASGRVGVPAALGFCALLMLGGLLVLLQMNRLVLLLGFLSLPVVLVYPLMKRVTFWPQLVLGLAFNWGAPMGWAAVRGRLDLPVLWLYVAGICWTLAYDTIYAWQDREGDSRLGLKSTALRFEGHVRAFVSVVFVLCGFFLVAAVGFSPIVLLALLPAFAHAAWQVLTWDLASPASALSRFKANVVFGLLVFFAFLAGNVGG